MAAAARTPMLDVKDFFGYTNMAQFGREWRSLDVGSKEALKEGIADGSLTY